MGIFQLWGVPAMEVLTVHISLKNSLNDCTVRKPYVHLAQNNVFTNGVHSIRVCFATATPFCTRSVVCKARFVLQYKIIWRDFQIMILDNTAPPLSVRTYWEHVLVRYKAWRATISLRWENLLFPSFAVYSNRLSTCLSDNNWMLTLGFPKLVMKGKWFFSSMAAQISTNIYLEKTTASRSSLSISPATKRRDKSLHLGIIVFVKI